MKHIILSLSFLWITVCGNAQIIAPDTVCVNEQVSFTTPEQGNVFSWNFDTVNLNLLTPTSTPVTSGAPLSTPSFITINEDNGNWYSFTGNHNTSEVIRFSYGTDPNSTPTVTNMGTFGQPANSQLQGVDVVRDSATGNWYGFVIFGASYQRLMRLDFGNSLANTPTATTFGPFTANLAWPHQLSIRKFGNEWVGFAANRSNGQLTRFDFGTSITNAPAATNLTLAGHNTPCNFVLHKQGADWYMFVTNLVGPSAYSRLNFGTDIKNNTPAITNLGNPGNVLNIPRGMNILASCDKLYMYLLNENGTLLKFDFGNDITNTPVITNVASFTGSSNCITPFIYNNELHALQLSWGTNAVYNLKLFTFPPGTINVNTNPLITRSFTTPGIYNITLFVDQGAIMGTRSFCKQIVVVSGRGNFLGPDTVLCDGTAYTLDATQAGATGYAWNTGAATPSITVTGSGTYWVQVSGQVCGREDTVTVTFSATPDVDLGPDILACDGDAVTLGPGGSFGSGSTPQWSTGAVTPTIQVTQSGDYRLTVTRQGCTGDDTITVTVNPYPVVDLGPDFGLCESALPVTLRSAQPPGTHYVWSNGLSDTQMQVTRSGTYWLEVTAANCAASDMIVITAVPDPEVYIGPDTTICEQTPLTIGTDIPGAAYAWNTAETTSHISVKTTDTYILEVSLDGCTVYDTAVITAMPDPDIDLGGDRDICPEQTIVLDGSYGTGSSYLWNTGDTTATYTATVAGMYAVRVISAYGCTGGDSALLTFYPKPTVSLGADTTVCEETPLLLQAWQVNADSLLWSDGSTDAGLYVQYGGTYTVTGINKCGTGADTIEVRQIFCDIWLPNAFTPNGDGVNDVFRILGNTGRLQGVTLSVFNRWGERVFVTNDKYKGWDGQQDGSDAMLGTYVYMLQYSLDGKPYLQKGNFHLLR